MTVPVAGVCDACGRLRALRPDGRLQAHKVPEVIRQRGQHHERKRRCPGSGQRPRRVER